MSIEGMTREEFAKASKLFGFLDDAGRQRMMAIAREEQYAAGSVICRELEAGAVFWVIQEGEVQVSVEDVLDEKEVATLGPRQFFGEISAILGQPRTATVVAKSDLVLLAFDRQPVLEILDDYPKVKEILGKVGLIRSEDTVEKLMSDD
ncbi:MAG: cyclic nucleotide-binding domain-containing protein [Deltaproteobacteria bacterium]|nr:cyclic nucleotide-binding domain-containing protein [Deltaproteobacteria bacterium]